MKKLSLLFLCSILFFVGCSNQTSNGAANLDFSTFTITSEDESDQQKLNEILDTVRKEAVVSELSVPDASELIAPVGGKETENEVDYAEDGYEYHQRTGFDSHGNTVYEILIDKDGKEYVFRTVEYVYDGEASVYENRKEYVVPGVNDTNTECITTTKLDKKGRAFACKATWAESKGQEPLTVDFVRYSSFSYIDFSDTDYYVESKSVEGKKGWDLHVESDNAYVTAFGNWSELPAYTEIEKYDNGRPKSCKVVGDDWTETYEFSQDGKRIKK